MTFPVVVQLTPAELSFALTVASQRLASSPANDRFLARTVSPFGSHYAGVMAELAAAKVLGGKVDQRVLRQGDRHAPDFVDREGRAIETKAILWAGRDPYLKLTQDELIPDRWYVPVRLQWPDSCQVFDAIPYADAKKGVRKNFGYGERLCIPIREEAA